MTGRGSTYAGRPAALPPPGYAASRAGLAVTRSPAGPAVVAFEGEDSRRAVFSFAGLPLRGWHQGLAVALADRTGPSGGLRTLASANTTWAVVKRLLRFLAVQPDSPARPADLTPGHLQRFVTARSSTAGSWAGWHELRSAGWLLARMPAGDRAGPDALDFAFQRVEGLTARAKTGYSDNELRQIIAAARSEVAGIRDRIRAGRALAARARQDPTGLTGQAERDARPLAEMTVSGSVPWRGPGPATQQLAGRLFVTQRDLWPLLTLLVALTGRSPDALKEVPAAHRVLSDIAVELVLVKRRRGEGRWHQTVTWEIGARGRELHQPGGFYLLLHDLMAAGRAFSGSPLVWSVWRAGPGGGEHVSPFSRSLDMPAYRQRWEEQHGLTGDDGRPLRIDLQRLKTSIEVRRTRQLGGHLPSAARTNTTTVLFRNYLRGDPSVRDWAEHVVGDAVADAEKAALQAHARAMRAMGGGPVVAGLRGRPFRAGMTGHDGQDLAGTAAEAAWSTCADPHAHPVTGKPCRASFLDCFHCGNCVITADHLPGLVSLADALASRRQQLGDAEWWQRYGPAWAAVRHDILPRFTAAQIRQARAAAPRDALLDLVEDPWEVP
jgi:hypothetical protein